MRGLEGQTLTVVQTEEEEEGGVMLCLFLSLCSKSETWMDVTYARIYVSFNSLITLDITSL